MEKISSPDGTTIACQCSGKGPPLILVPGAGAANPTAWPAAPALAEHFRLYAIDRRGRGESGDSPDYAIEREYEDIAALVDSFETPVNLLGHSFGGLLALEAALRTRNLRKLVLYDPVSPVEGEAGISTDLIERLEDLLAAGDREGVLTLHYQVDAGMTPEEIELMKASPAWPARLATAHTLPRELRAAQQYRFEARRFKDLHTPTLLLLGGENPPEVNQASETLAAALANSRVTVMPGQAHVAMYTAPDVFVQAVRTFLLA